MAFTRRYFFLRDLKQPLDKFLPFKQCNQSEVGQPRQTYFIGPKQRRSRANYEQNDRTASGPGWEGRQVDR